VIPRRGSRLSSSPVAASLLCASGLPGGARVSDASRATTPRVRRDGGRIREITSARGPVQASQSRGARRRAGRARGAAALAASGRPRPRTSRPGTRSTCCKSSSPDHSASTRRHGRQGRHEADAKLAAAERGSPRPRPRDAGEVGSRGQARLFKRELVAERRRAAPAAPGGAGRGGVGLAAAGRGRRGGSGPKANLVNPRSLLAGGGRAGPDSSRLRPTSRRPGRGRARPRQLDEARANRQDCRIAPSPGPCPRTAEPGRSRVAGTAIVTLVNLASLTARVRAGGQSGASARQRARLSRFRSGRAAHCRVMRIDPRASFTPENTYFARTASSRCGLEASAPQWRGLPQARMPADRGSLSMADCRRPGAR